MNIKDLIATIQAASQTTGNVTININLTQPDVDVEDDDDVVESDFELGDRVLVCHIRHDGERVHTMGTVTEFGEDEVGPYTRITGDNGKHYRTGLRYNEERLGSLVVRLDEGELDL